MDSNLQPQGAAMSRAGQSGLLTEESSTPEAEVPCARGLWRKGKVKESWESCLEMVAHAQALKDR